MIYDTDSTIFLRIANRHRLEQKEMSQSPCVLGSCTCCGGKGGPATKFAYRETAPLRTALPSAS